MTGGPKYGELSLLLASGVPLIASTYICWATSWERISQ